MDDPPPPIALPPLPHTFRPSVPPAVFGICVQAALVFTFARSGSWFAWVPVASLTLLFASIRRQRLLADERGVTVVVLRRRFVPWAEVSGFERASSGGAGVRVVTASGRVSSRAPTSWWGGPATPAQVATLERIRQRALGFTASSGHAGTQGLGG